MAFVAKRSVGVSGMSAEIKRLASYMNTHIVALNNVAAIATADGSDPATTQALANATKVKVNALLAALVAEGLMSP